MRPPLFLAEDISRLLRRQKIATMPELMTALGTNVERTVFRKLSQLPYRTSYSHRGGYYTLDGIARFDERGLWSYKSAHFSKHGTLVATATVLVEASESGYFVEELDNLLRIGTKDVLRTLVRKGGLARELISGQYLYCSVDPERHRRQVVARQSQGAGPVLAGVGVLPHELKAAIILFFSLLDEKQRRLYAGLEALKTGRGGDGWIADLLGLDVGTVARGRRELLEHDVQIDRTRRVGGGRKAVEKKRQS